MVCRLKYRKGEPLGLTIYSGLSFVSLPLEIRNKIYGLLLVASEAITVYSSPNSLAEEHLRRPRRRYEKVDALTFGLLWVNKTISIEAAAVFYHHNIFKFSGSQQCHLVDSWDALYSFLYTIGDRNRACLQYLEADISRPRAVTKDANGTISSLLNGSFWMRRVYARDQHARIYPPVHDQQYLGPSVDYVSPAIEAVLRILGSEGSKIRLSLIMEFGSLPEITVCESNGLLSGWSGEVPDYVEQTRKRFTSLSSGDGARVEVLWKGTYFKSEFLSRAEKIESSGWEVLEMQDIIRPTKENGFGRIGVTTCVTLWREGTVRTNTINHPQSPIYNHH